MPTREYSDTATIQFTAAVAAANVTFPFTVGKIIIWGDGTNDFYFDFNATAVSSGASALYDASIGQVITIEGGRLNTMSILRHTGDAKVNVIAFKVG